VVGASLFTWLQDLIAREFQYWRAALGVAILLLVMVFPLGVAGSIKRLFSKGEVAV
jgi:branched-chain amino acid transport system permease protein